MKLTDTMFKKVLFAAVLLLPFVCCCRPKGGEPSASDYAPYVKAYTGGIIPADAEIRIDLVEDVPSEQRWTEGLFSFSPSLKGTINWATPSSVRFIPDEGALQGGKVYEADFALYKLRDIHRKDLRHFRFSFTVKQPVPETVAEEPESSAPFCVRSVSLQEGYIDVIFNWAPVNAELKGLVELEGASRFYTEVKDTHLRVYFEGRKGDLKLSLSSSLKNSRGDSLGQDFVRTFPLGEIKPALEIPLSGSILPDRARLQLPFRAVNLSAVEIRIVKIYEQNVLMYLQDGELGGGGPLRRCGRLVYHRDIPLDASKDLHQWNDFSIDLSELIRKEPGALYRIRLSFREEHSLYGGREAAPLSVSDGKPTAEDDALWDKDSAWYWDNDYDWSRYDYREADDPTKPSYYMDSDRFPYVQLLSSDLGIIAKYAGGDRIWLSVSDIMSAKPVSGATLEVYDYQLQRLALVKSGSDGLAEAKLARKPFVVVARNGESVGYLKVDDGSERSLSRFDTGGKVVRDGIKAFIYGERGVWRPGDTLHVTMLVRDAEGVLPSAHPVTMDLFTPEGSFHTRLVRSGTDGFYSFDIPTREDDPTGFWNAYFKLGGNSFHKSLHVETVKPNRIKINAAYGSGAILRGGAREAVSIQANWLSGPAASGLECRATISLKPSQTKFKGFEQYSFRNPASQNFRVSEQELFKVKLDETGCANPSVKFPEAKAAPGLVSAQIITSVAESGGDESFTTVSLPLSPFDAYVGIGLPDGEDMETDADHSIHIAVVDAQGKRLSGRKLEYRIFKTGWSWWWDSTDGDLDSYVNGSSVQKVKEGKITSSGADSKIPFRIDYPDWGRYLVLVRDVEGGHVSGRFFTVDWPAYRGRALRSDPESLTMLSFSMDKSSYQAGEKATVFIPGSPGAQALVSLENASGVMQRRWVPLTSGDTPYSFAVTPAMAPNFYVHVTLVQPYGNGENDLPLRLYGVQRVLVEDPASHLEPVIKMPDSLHPEEEFKITVSEKNGRPMTYTLALVDEGLLDLTAFRTPDPWKAMNEPEALGVHTWDLYDRIAGGFSGRFAPIFSVGGDQDNIVEAKKDNRFNPVVMYLPPRTLKGSKDVHKLRLPMYVGSVRVMLVCAHDGAFGSAEKTVPVNSPLMILSSLPRALSTTEETTLAVNVFVSEDKLKDVQLDVNVKGPVKLIDAPSQKLHFAQAGDRLARFALKATGEGTATVSIHASGDGCKASETLSLKVGNPSPEITLVSRETLDAGGSVALDASEGGTLQLSSFPSLNARDLWIKVKQYPYSCTEQLSSRGLAALHLIPLLDKADADEARELIPVLISQIYARQGADGGFAYWKGDKSDTWVSSLAGAFLSEADKAGFAVDKGVLGSWERYQKKMSQVYKIAGSSVFSQMDEAFRLWSLAVAGKSQSAAMNRLKEAASTDSRARWILASAYALSGKQPVAREIIGTIDSGFEEYTPYNLTLGSSLRDRMMALEALALTGSLSEARPLATELAQASGSLSTQETAFAAIGLDRLHAKLGDGGIDARVNGKEQSSELSLVSLPVSGPVQVENKASGKLFVSLVKTVKPAADEAVPARSNGLELSVRFLDNTGRECDVTSLRQGSIVSAVFQVKNLSKTADYKNLALSQNLPSGWEIMNARLFASEGEAYDHSDIRDNSVAWFFDLPHGRSKSFKLSLRAAYEGRYILPAASCEAMYEPEICANTASGKADVVR